MEPLTSTVEPLTSPFTTEDNDGAGAARRAEGDRGEAGAALEREYTSRFLRLIGLSQENICVESHL
eukprot:8425169-Pyramimonas_sp.AAC.2